MDYQALDGEADLVSQAVQLVWCGIEGKGYPLVALVGRYPLRQVTWIQHQVASCNVGPDSGVAAVVLERHVVLEDELAAGVLTEHRIRRRVGLGDIGDTGNKTVSVRVHELTPARFEHVQPGLLDRPSQLLRKQQLAEGRQVMGMTASVNA